MPLLDPSTVPAVEVHTDTRPLADLAPCDDRWCNDCHHVVVEPGRHRCPKEDR